jgi:hypothetical protein
MNWHFAPAGFSLSPHVDAQRKLVSHIFYFNTEADWDPQWGGQTVVLDDQGRFSITDHPSFSSRLPPRRSWEIKASCFKGQSTRGMGCVC